MTAMQPESTFRILCRLNKCMSLGAFELKSALIFRLLVNDGMRRVDDREDEEDEIRDAHG